MGPRAWAVVLLALGACYSANPAVNVPCSANDRACPDGQFCDLLREPPLCVTVPLDAAIDASVACDPSADMCPADNPVCDPTTRTCRRCVEDADCKSGACFESNGTCKLESEVLYVDKAIGDNANTCTRAAQCATITRALSLVTPAGRTFIRVAPATYTEQLTVNTSVTMSGTSRSAVTILTSTALVPTISISNQGSILTFETMQVSSQQSSGIDSNTGTTLRMFGATVDGANSQGVRANQSVVEIRQSTLTNCNRAIEVTNDGSLLVHRSLFKLNRDFAIRTSSTSYEITSSVFVDNERGISFDGSLIAGSRFEHNTVVGVTNDRAVRCGNQGHIIGNSIFFNNNPPAVDTNRCVLRYSLTNDQLLPGTGNLTGDPGFVSFVDFHLAAGSKCVDTADQASIEAVDFDGQTRPRGTRRDMGAFEH